MKLRTIDNGDFEIELKAIMKSPYPKLNREVTVGGHKADIVAVTEQLTCTQNGRIYKGYHAYIMADVTE
jgi:hypothetical protein